MGGERPSGRVQALGGRFERFGSMLQAQPSAIYARAAEAARVRAPRTIPSARSAGRPRRGTSLKKKSDPLTKQRQAQMAAADQSVQSDARRMGLGGLEKELHASFQGSRRPTRQKNEHYLVGQ